MTTMNKLNRSLEFVKNGFALTIFALIILTTFVCSADPSVEELRAELQANSKFATENFNTWQNIRKQIIENKNKILEHRQAMQTCLTSLRKSFDEKLFNSCSVDNYGFSYTLALMPNTSTALKFPSKDFTGGSLSRATLELTFEFKKWITMGQRDVVDFREAATPLYENYLYIKLTAQFDAAKERGEKAAYCTSTVALTFETASNGARLKLLVAKAFGDLVGINLALTELKENQVKVNQGIKYCGSIGVATFGANKTAIDQLVTDSESDLNSQTVTNRIERFCSKMTKFNDDEINQICSSKSETPEILTSIHNLVTQKINQMGGQ